ncbi:MAG: D-alanine--D-alanine ligase [Pseudomonadota bacterium]
MNRRVAVLCGGPGAEADVSRSSAQEVAEALSGTGARVERFEVDQTLTQNLLAWGPDLVFPALHGTLGEDGTIQGYLELLGLPYVGSGVRGSAAAMDKTLAKLIYRSHALPVADDRSFDGWPAGVNAEDLADELMRTLGPALVVKPRSEGSAVGVHRVRDRAALLDALEAARGWSNGWLVEPFIDGMEATVGVLDLHGREPQIMAPIEIVTAKDEWYDFDNRYAVGKSEHITPARLAPAILQSLQQVALAAHRALRLRDLSRSDFLVTADGRIALLETNTMPGMTPTSLYPDGARSLGFDFPSLMTALCQSALDRYEARSSAT